MLPGAASAPGAPPNCGANCSGGGTPPLGPPKPGSSMPGRRPMAGMPTPGVIMPGGSMAPGGSIMPGAIPGAMPMLWGGPSPGSIIPAEACVADSEVFFNSDCINYARPCSGGTSMPQSSQGLNPAQSQGPTSHSQLDRAFDLDHGTSQMPHLAGVTGRTGRGSRQKEARSPLLGKGVHWLLRGQAAGAHRCLRLAKLLKIPALPISVVLHAKPTTAAGSMKSTVEACR